VFSFPPGAGDLEPFTLEPDAGAARGSALLVHGFCGTPPEMRDLGEHLASRGLRVRGMLLPGHGTTPEDLDGYGWQDWVRAAEAELHTLEARGGPVFVAGQSMGGTLSLLLAARNPTISAVATMSALVDLGRLNHAKIRAGRFVLTWHYPDQDDIDLWDRDAVRRLRSYTKRSLKAHNELLDLMRATSRELPRIRVPALVIHGRRDRVVPPRNAQFIASRIGPSATVRYFERSGHAMTVDVDGPEIYSLVADHFLAAAPAGATSPAAIGGR